MFVEERQREILEFLHQNGKVLVKDLSERYQVTPDLIRKDLAKLEKEGLLKRTYGGAIPLIQNSVPQPADDSHENNTEVKQRIAEKAESLIRNGDTVFLDLSSINVEIARQLVRKNRNVTIVTNMINVLEEIPGESRVKLIFIGGKMNKLREGFTGAATIEWMSRFQFDLSFIGVVGIDLVRNSATTYEIDDALTKTGAIKISNKSYIVAESSKFNSTGNCRSASLNSFSGIITDVGLDPEIVEKLTQIGLQVLLV